MSENVALVEELGHVLSGRDPADLGAWVAKTQGPAVFPELRRLGAVVEAVRWIVRPFLTRVASLLD